MANGSVFKDPAIQRHYEEYGYAVVPALGGDIVRDLLDAYAQLNLEDKYGIGYKVSLYSASMDTRRQARDFLIKKAFPALDAFLVDRYPYMATFLVKESGGHCIPAHQDWSHCDEAEQDSVMCWIPLCDVDEHNGALGFINGSHRYFDYLRVFPYQIATTPVDRHGLQLLSYLNMQRMRAGNAVIFNNRTIHGSLPNFAGERRIALSFALHPASQPLISYYLKPKTGAQVVLRYRATPDFYLEYPNPRMGEMYARGLEIPGYQSDEMPYHVPTIEWDEFEKQLRATGNPFDPLKASQVQAPTALASAARNPSGGAKASA